MKKLLRDFFSRIQDVPRSDENGVVFHHDLYFTRI